MTDDAAAGEPSDIGDATIGDPAFWLKHPRALREALIDAAGLEVPVTEPMPTLGGIVRTLASAPGRLVAAVRRSLEIAARLSEARAVRLTLTVEEAAELLGISRAFEYEAVHRGEIPSVRIGRRILVPKAALQAAHRIRVNGAERRLAVTDCSAGRRRRWRRHLEAGRTVG